MIAFAILGWVIAAAAVFAPTTLGLSPRVQGAALGDTLPGDALHPYRGDSSSEEGDVGDVDSEPPEGAPGKFRFEATPPDGEL